MAYEPPQTWVRPANPVATASLVLGICAVATVFWRWLPFIGIVFSVVAIIIAIPAVITGHVGRRRAGELGGEGAGLALAGLVTGYFTVAFAIIMPIVSLVLFIFGAAGVAEEYLPQLIEWIESFGS